MPDLPRAANRPDYASLRGGEQTQKPEVSQEPPKQLQADRTGGPITSGMQEMNAWGNDYQKRVAAHQEQRHQAKTADKQPEQTKDDQSRIKEARIQELAKTLAPSQKGPDRQREREPER